MLQRFVHGVGYTAWLIKEIFAAGFSAAAAAFKPNTGLDPIIIYYPLRLTTDWQIFWYSTSITVTPGTLSLGLRYPAQEDGPIVLLVQAAFGSDPLDQIAGLIDMEERINPAVKATPLDPASIGWDPYVDLGDPDDHTLPPAERMD
ncbi:monovalent cation/H+ antiporter subunit E [Corynebacterium pseudogenitalium]|uniref:Monovalent cation/H+ antiporter subunit E n=1 Tax=Corynebacterium pseudogenitalium TaxID=38303 RepID=A0ABD4TQT4_9CORY|nr:monovalent cation/H+ antiporter subunit E [Corynebacterium pseudogenitalium]MCQ4614138.1 monovalent cation/H+ antiporter subunit E [Corynebacterium pseudogenitalium]